MHPNRLKLWSLLILITLLSSCATLSQRHAYLTPEIEKLLDDSIKTGSVSEKGRLRREIIERAPGSAYAYFAEGYLAFPDVGKCVELYSKAISMKKDLWIAIHNRGDMYMNLQSYDKAITDYTEVIRLNPSHKPAYQNRAWANIYQNKLDLALNDAELLIKIDSNYADGYLIRGNVYALQENFAPALIDLNKALNLYPSFVDHSYETRAVCNTALGHYDDALQDLSRVIMSKPRNTKALRLMGYIYEKKENFNEASNCYHKVLELGSKDVIKDIERLQKK